jgi:hypothetical protein
MTLGVGEGRVTDSKVAREMNKLVPRCRIAA